MSVSVPPAPAAEVPNDPIFRFSVEQYHEMIQAGILTDDDPVELLDGWLVTKMSKNPPHTICTENLWEILVRLTPKGWFVRCQEPITTTDSEPEPDLFIVRGTRHDYQERHPGAEDVAIVIEVSDVTLERDRKTKQQIYASASIACYWIVNLQESCVEVYTDPADTTYAKSERHEKDGTLTLRIDGNEIGQIAVADVMP